MPFSYAEEFLPLLYNALEEELGFFVKTDNLDRLVAVLHDARAKIADETLRELIIFKVEPDTVLIAKRSAEVPE